MFVTKGNKKRNKQTVSLAVMLFAAFIALVFTMTPSSRIASASGNIIDPVVLTRTANLVAPSGSVNPHGLATYTVYESGNRELEIEAEDVSLADGTSLTNVIAGNTVGQSSVLAQKAKLKLKTQNGDTVPMVNGGDIAQVRNGAAVLVSGTFGGNSTPTPTPTVSPSPTVSPTPTVSPSPTPSPGESEIYAGLSGATVNGVMPRGYSTYELHSSRRELEVRVRQVNLPNGTSLNVTVNSVAVGNLILENNGEGRLRLRTDRGDTVPVVTVGMPIVLKNGSTTILSGTFAGGVGPSPSPTPANQGRFFEGHLSRPGDSGTYYVPKGEVKVRLNAAETQVEIYGEYSRLTSAQTSTQIISTTGSVTTTIHDFGALGGTERNFGPVTVNVTAAQVAQLRAGLWIGVVSTVNAPTGLIQGAILNDSHGSDFGGDGQNDFAVFRPAPAGSLVDSGTFYVLDGVSGAFTQQQFGQTGDKVVVGDYDGDGKVDAAVYRNGTWLINRSSDGGLTTQQFGLPTDVPVIGDFDGDNRQDLAVYRNGVWYISRSSDSGFVALQFGLPADKPVAEDFDGDGKDDIAVFRPSEGNWYMLRSSDGGFQAVHWGATGDIPTLGDFDGDGQADIAVFRPTTGVWYVYRSSDSGFTIIGFGLNGDIPVPGNFDSDNKTDFAVFRPSTGFWYVRRSTDGGFYGLPFGLPTDIPVTAR